MTITVSLNPAPTMPGQQLLARIRCHPNGPSGPHGAHIHEADFNLPLHTIDQQSRAEHWWVDGAVTARHDGVLHHRSSQHYSFSWLQISPAEHGGISAATRWAYEQLTRSLHNGAHSYLLKIWHYLPAINQGEGDDEHYRQFCAGREQALRSLQGAFTPLPAATAIGIPDENAPLVFYWLSADEPGANIENPRQTHAWKYPREYGPASPNFSRGTLSEQAGLFLISGTASVVGHNTAHPHDTAAQCGEMLSNLNTLLTSARQRCTHLPEVKQLRGPLRLYLRCPADWPKLRDHCQTAGLPIDQVIPCHGDICRDDLMVELDGVQTLA